MIWSLLKLLYRLSFYLCLVVIGLAIVLVKDWRFIKTVFGSDSLKDDLRWVFTDRESGTF